MFDYNNSLTHPLQIKGIIFTNFPLLINDNDHHNYDWSLHTTHTLDLLIIFMHVYVLSDCMYSLEPQPLYQALLAHKKTLAPLK